MLRRDFRYRTEKVGICLDNNSDRGNYVLFEPDFTTEPKSFFFCKRPSLLKYESTFIYKHKSQLLNKDGEEMAHPISSRSSLLIVS